MTLYNQLIENLNEPFEGAREDLKIISFKISTQEGECTFVDLICKKESVHKKGIILSLDNHPFFKGILLKGIQLIEPSQMRLRYIAKPCDIRIEDREKSLLNDISISDFRLPIIHPFSHELFYFSHLADKDDGINLTSYIIEKSIKIEHVRTPFDSIHLKVVAQWEQKLEGVFNLFPYLKKEFPSGLIQTLTGNAFERSFPKIGQYLNGDFQKQKTGYRVLYSRLKEKKIQKNMIVLINKETPLKIPWRCFEGELFIQWKSRFMRREISEHYFSWDKKEGAFKRISCKKDNALTVTMKVNPENISSDRSHFFDTEIGRKSIYQALKQSLFKGIHSRLNRTLHCSIPFDVGISLNIGQSVLINYHNKKIKGKISKLEGRMDSSCALMHVCFSVLNEYISLEKMDDEIEERLNSLKFESIEGSEDDIFLKDEDAFAKDFIKNIRITNHINDQIFQMKGQEFQDIHHVKRMLKNMPTMIELELQNLKNKSIQTRVLKVKGE